MSLCISSLLLTGDYFFNHLNTTNLIAYLSLQVGINIWIAIMWQFSPLIIQILIEKFKESCKTVKNLEMDGIVLVERYKNLVQGLQNFLFFYFSIAQMFLVLYIFFTFSSAIKKTVLNNNDISMMTGSFLNIVSITYILVSLTGSVEDSSDCMQAIKEQAQDMLVTLQDKQRRQRLKYLIQKIDNLKGMSARGYFTVDKSTLTSMVSVR